MDTYICNRYYAGAPQNAPYPHLLLSRDNWNDYSYYTLFKAKIKLDSYSEVDLDEVKIMVYGGHEQQGISES